MNVSRGVLVPQNHQDRDHNTEGQNQKLSTHFANTESEKRISVIEGVVADLQKKQHMVLSTLSSAAGELMRSRARSRHDLNTTLNTLQDRHTNQCRQEGEHQRQKAAVDAKNDRARKHLCHQQQLQYDMTTKTHDAQRQVNRSFKPIDTYSAEHADEYQSLLKVCMSNNAKIDTIKQKVDGADVDRTKLQTYTKVTGVVLNPPDTDFDHTQTTSATTPTPSIHSEPTNVLVGIDRISGVVLRTNPKSAAVVRPFSFDTTTHSHAFIQRSLWQMIREANSPAAEPNIAEIRDDDNS